MLAMDTPHLRADVLQRSIASLEARYKDLQESAEGKFNDLITERDQQSDEKHQVLQSLLELKDQMKLELESSRNEFALALLQIRQLQDELNHYFLLSRHQAEVLQASQAQLNRMIVTLMSLR